MTIIGEIKRGTEIGKRPYQRYIWQSCLDCGKERWVRLIKGEPDTNRCHACVCASPEYRTKNSQGHKGHHNYWKGGRSITKRGYIKILLSPDDFFYPMTNKTGYVFEHRLVVAKVLDRCLLSWEVVHHKNGIKGDNGIDNLELLKCQGKHNTQINKRIKELASRVTLLEVENILLRKQLQEVQLRRP